MTCICKIELHDYKHATWLHIKPRKGFAILGIIMLALLLGTFVITLIKLVRTGQGLPITLALVGAIAYLAFYFLLWFPRRLSRLYAQSKLMQETFTFQITDAYLITKSSYGESKIPWETFHKWKADSKMILIYQSDYLFHIFPQRAFASQEEFQSFRRLLSSKLSCAQ